MIDLTLSTLVWIIGPILLALAMAYAIMRRRRSRIVTLPPDHPAREHPEDLTAQRVAGRPPEP